ncbi:MAG: hypothetical protein QMD46_00570 [Methanomicrobiales archaeon]|nr:hypothetical protein [Methanomicrobiales archaeon]MDI6875921.1 hypothetical protein [Methanomicrobiales archaeon]
MEPETLLGILAFLGAEERLIRRFDLPAEAFIPLLLSLRSGGDWSYAAGSIRTLSLLEKTTVYDSDRRLGYTYEEIFLFVNPRILQEDGTVHRLEKCGREEVRRLVRRPYTVVLEGDRLFSATVHPLRREIALAELPDRQRTFQGSSAYAASHEMEHLEHEEIAGESLYSLRFV